MKIQENQELAKICADRRWLYREIRRAYKAGTLDRIGKLGQLWRATIAAQDAANWREYIASRFGGSLWQ